MTASPTRTSSAPPNATIFRIQIERTIERHMRVQQRPLRQGDQGPFPLLHRPGGQLRQ